MTKLTLSIYDKGPFNKNSKCVQRSFWIVHKHLSFAADAFVESFQAGQHPREDTRPHTKNFSSYSCWPNFHRVPILFLLSMKVNLCHKICPSESFFFFFSSAAALLLVLVLHWWCRYLSAGGGLPSTFILSAWWVLISFQLTWMMLSQSCRLALTECEWHKSRSQIRS